MSYKETADDLGKKYHATFVSLKRQIVFVQHFDGSGDSLSVYASKSTEDKGQSVIFSVEDLEPINFNAMYINNTVFHEKVENPAIPCVYVSRKPRRQWKRGLCRENTALKCPLTALYLAYGKDTPPWAGTLSVPLIARLMKPTYPTLREAVDLVKAYQAIAISSMFAITLSSYSTDKYLLASPFGFIGECTGDAIWVKHPPALQEVRDFISRSGQRVAVEMA